MNIIDFYTKQNFIITSGKITTKYNKQNELKKEFKHCTKSWKDEPMYNSKLNGLAILTGKKSNITVIDIDGETPESIKLKDLMDKSCNYIIKTNKGFHYYYKYFEDIKTTTNTKIQIDIRNDDGLIYAPPSHYINIETGETIKYEIVKFPENEINEIDIETKNYLNQLFNKTSTKTIKTDIKTDEKPKKIDTKKNTDTPITNTIIKSNSNNITDEDLKIILDNLDVERYNNYNDWITLYFIFINEKLNLDLFDLYSKKSKSYDKEANERILKNVNSKNGYTIATLYKWIKEDNLEIFKQIIKTNNWFYNIKIGTFEMSKICYEYLKDNYIYDYNLGWFEYNENNILLNRGQIVPLSLLNNIYNIVNTLCQEQLNNLSFNDAKFKEKNDFILKIHSFINNVKNRENIIKDLKFAFLDEEISKKINNINLFSFNNILFDKTILKFRKIEKKDYITKTTNYNLNLKVDEDIKKELNNILLEIFNTEDLKNYYLQIVASSLFGNIDNKIYIHTGEGGNGKSLLSNFINKSFGEYFMSTSNNFLTGSLKKGSADPELVNTQFKRYITVQEPDESNNNKFNVSNLKNFSGNDFITCRGLHKEPITFKANFILNICCNDIPKLSNVDKGIIRRLRIINYPNLFVNNPKNENEKKVNTQLNVKLENEKYINNFMLMLFDIIKNNKSIEEPQEVINYTKQYLEDNNPIINWFYENYEITEDPKDVIKSSEILNNYNFSNPTEKIRTNEFSKYMENMNIKKIEKQKVKYYINIKIKD